MFVAVGVIRHVAAVVAVVVSAAAASGQTPTAPTRTVSGTIYDSTAHHPLAGATINLVAAAELSAPTRSAISDNAGNYEIQNVPAGAYLIGFFHPLLDSLGIEAPTLKVVVPIDGRATSVRADMGVPSERTIRNAICDKPTPKSDSTGVLIGHLQDASSEGPLGAGKVTAQWVVLTFERGHLVRSLPTVNVTPSSGGWFAFCGLPTSTQIAIQATSGADSSGVLLIEVASKGITRRDFYVGHAETVLLPSAEPARAGDSLAVPRERVRRGTGRLSGTVRDGLSGKPLPGVQLTVEGTGLTTTVDEQGAFTLSGLPLGTQVLLARKVGYLPDERPVDVLAAAPAHIDPVMVTAKSVLDTVKITGQRIYSRDRNGFERRQRTGIGHYLGPDQIANIRPFQTTDLLRRVPSVRIQEGLFDREIRMRGMMGGSCQPSIYLDGVHERFFSGSDLDNFVRPDAVAGIEIYSSPVETPPEFLDVFSNCGSIVVWTRVPPRNKEVPKP